MIRISFDGSDQRVSAALRARGARIVPALTEELDLLMLELQARIQRKLSGEVLKSRRGGGGLLGTVRKDPTRVEGPRIVGRVTAGGGLWWWARVHEEGGEKTYEILPGILTGKSNKKALAFMKSGHIGVGGQGRSGMTRLYFTSGARRGELRPRGRGQGKFGEFRAAGGVVVRKVIHPPLKKRSFMRSSLDEMRAEIVRRIFSRAARAVRE